MKSKKYSRKKNYCASSGSGTRRRFRGGSAAEAGLTDTSKMSPEELADYKRENPEKFAAEKKKIADNATERGNAMMKVDKDSKKLDVSELQQKQDRVQLKSFQNRLTDQGKRQAKERESEIREAATEEEERTSATGANSAEKAKVDEVASKLRQMERGEGQSNAARRMSDVQRTAAKVATAEREQELADAQEAQPKTKKGLQTTLSKLVKGEDLPDMIKEYPDSLNRSIKLKNVKVPLGKRTKKFEDGTSVETNDKRLRRLLSQITQFTEPGDDITLENVDLDFEGTRKMLELQQEYGEKAIEHSFEFIGLAIAAIATKQLMPIFTLPFTGPILQVAKEEMSTLMGLFKFNFGLVLQIVETLYESRNRLKRIRDRGSFDKFSVDKDKSEAKISEQAYTRASTDLVAKKQQAQDKIREMATKDPLGRSANTTLAALGPGGKYDSSKAAIGYAITPNALTEAAEAATNKAAAASAEAAKDADAKAKDADAKATEAARETAEEAAEEADAATEAQDMLKILTNALSAVEAAQTKIELVVDAADSASQAKVALTRVGIGDEEKNALEEKAKKEGEKLKKVATEAAQAVQTAAQTAEAAKEAAKTAKATAEKAKEDVTNADKILANAETAATNAKTAASHLGLARRWQTAAAKAGEAVTAATKAGEAVTAATNAKAAAAKAVTAATKARDTAEEAAKKKTDGAEAAEAVKAAAEKAKTAAGEDVRIAKINLAEANTKRGGGAKNKTRAKSGGGGTQLPYDQYADTGYNTGTSFFAFEGDMGGRFDNTFTPTAEQSSFFKSIDYYDKV